MLLARHSREGNETSRHDSRRKKILFSCLPNKGRVALVGREDVFGVVRGGFTKAIVGYILFATGRSLFIKHNASGNRDFINHVITFGMNYYRQNSLKISVYHIFGIRPGNFGPDGVMEIRFCILLLSDSVRRFSASILLEYNF
jgi:hypothetical protein